MPCTLHVVCPASRRPACHGVRGTARSAGDGRTQQAAASSQLVHELEVAHQAIGLWRQRQRQQLEGVLLPLLRWHHKHRASRAPGGGSSPAASSSRQLEGWLSLSQEEVGALLLETADVPVEEHLVAAAGGLAALGGQRCRCHSFGFYTAAA